MVRMRTVIQSATHRCDHAEQSLFHDDGVISRDVDLWYRVFQRLRILFSDNDRDGQHLACVVQLCGGKNHVLHFVDDLAKPTRHRDR